MQKRISSLDTSSWIIFKWRCKIKSSPFFEISGLTKAQAKKYSSLKHKKYRNEYGLFIADGPHLVEAAINSRWPIERVILRPDSAELSQNLGIVKDLAAMTSATQFSKISPSKTPQGILAIVRTVDFSSQREMIIHKARKLVACDNISDPGNLGTIIRTAVAFGYDALICLGQCAEFYNPKTVQATQGAIFNLPFFEFSDNSAFISYFKDDFDIITISNKAKIPLSEAPPIKKPLLVLGSEARGISRNIGREAKYNFRIEQTSRIESLNVAVAAGVAMYRFSVV
jgi:TrmH family RNA methyltransferase